MKGLVNRRQRVLRVRAVQHSMAVAETARARDEANGIAHNLERLRAVRPDLHLSGAFIVGFPEQTAADFPATPDLVDAVGYGPA